MTRPCMGASLEGRGNRACGLCVILFFFFSRDRKLSLPRGGWAIVFLCLCFMYLGLFENLQACDPLFFFFSFFTKWHTKLTLCCNAMSRAVDILSTPVVLLVVLDLWFYPDACWDAFVSCFLFEGNDCLLNERPVTRHMLSRSVFSFAQ